MKTKHLWNFTFFLHDPNAAILLVNCPNFQQMNNLPHLLIELFLPEFQPLDTDALHGAGGVGETEDFKLLKTGYDRQQINYFQN